eukprot:TRINITY_DN6412_c0_g1_i1.p1 TRINITY_DN6412_c0_g1~~TRINITY_DN6412_c0_g1_i1.p1  ORF type:complete len:346 (+),score=64.00 TRINITY_DN6412_c0_g1_i1:165-1202(+)
MKECPVVTNELSQSIERDELGFIEGVHPDLRKFPEFRKEIILLAVRHSSFRIVTFLTFCDDITAAETVQCIIENDRPELLKAVNPLVNLNRLLSLFTAVQQNKASIVKALLAFPGVNVNAADRPSGHTPLQLAASCNHFDVVRTLLGSPAINPNIVGPDGTALEIAISRNLFDIVKLLVALPSIDLSKKSGKMTPLELATSKSLSDIVGLLSEKTVCLPSRLEDSQQKTDEAEITRLSQELETAKSEIADLKKKLARAEGRDLTELNLDQINQFLADTRKIAELAKVRKNELLEDRKQCKICFDKEVKCVFLNCGHSICCKDCGQLQKLCPICRREVAQVVEIFN